MARKLTAKDLEDCRTGRDYVELLQGQDGKMQKVGSYQEYAQNGYNAFIPDTDRTLPKTSRDKINAVLLKIFVLTVLVGIVLWIVF